jgi:hypothetical protein
METSETLVEGVPMWTVYYRPADHPGSEYVTRSYTTTAHGEVPGYIRYCPDLDTARGWIEHEGGSANLGRQPGDDPVIVETWV